MPNQIAGPGQNLPLSVVYPSNLYQAPVTQRGNTIALAGGETWVIPATGPQGWWIDASGIVLYQVFDPVTQIWRGLSSARNGPQNIYSDGVNYRLANLTGCPVAAVVTNGGSGYAQATTTVVAATGNSTWYPIVGGQLTITVTKAGSGYGVAPTLLIDPPTPPGVQASAVATIANGTISAITTINEGAGYTANPVVQVIPVATDPNFIAGTVVNGTATATTISSTAITAVLCTNNGVPVSAAPSLTVAGAGTTATVSSVWMSTVTGITIVGAGSGVVADNELISVGGRTAAVPAFTPGNPAIDLSTYTPRPAVLQLSVTSTTVSGISATYDSGLFTGTPNGLLLQNAPLTTVATISFTLGTLNATVIMQPN